MLLQLAAELSWLFVAAILALALHGNSTRPLGTLAPALVFAVLMVFLNGAFGLYRRDHKLRFGEYVTRLFLAMLIGAPIAYLVAAVLPGGDDFQSTFREAVVLAFGGLVLVRQVVVWHLVPALLPHRVLVLGTGSMTHNLRRVFAHGLDAPADQPEIAESTAFRRWMLQRGAERDWDALFDYRRLAPHAADMHPTDEHLLPWYIAAGAGGRDTTPIRIHDSVTFGSLAMDAYAFGPEAETLKAALG